MNHDFLVSQLNFRKEVKKSFNLPTDVTINDCTLRESEQVSPLSVEEKIALARKIEAIGVKQIQGGVPGESKIDLIAIKGMKKEKINAKIEALVGAYVGGFKNDYPWKRHIDAAVESGADLVNIVFPTSQLFLKNVLQISEKAMLDVVTSAVEYAKEQDFYATFSSLDGTRTDLQCLGEVHDAVVDAGVDRVCICDTAGAICPSAMKFLIESIKQTVKVPIGVHCHNDLGLALANSLAALEGGAEVIDVTVNGIGERAGNVSLDELAVTLKVFYGIDSGIKMKELCNISNFVGKLFNFPVVQNKHLTGERVFAHSADTHVKAVESYSFAIEAINPQMVGNRRKIIISKYSGPYTVKVKAEELGISIPEDKLQKISDAVQKEATEKKNELTDEEFSAIIEKGNSC